MSSTKLSNKATRNRSDDSRREEDFNLNELIIDESDFCRGFGEDTNKYTEKYFENDEDAEEVEEEEEDEKFDIDDDFKAPEMPEEFYSNVDMFLRRPAPKLRGEDIVKKKDPKDDGHSIPMLPKIAKQKEPSESIVQEKVGKKMKKKSTKEATERVINNALLKEAFAYTDQLLREAVIQEAREKQELADQSNRKEKVLPKSAPPNIETVFGHPTMKSQSNKTASEGGSGVGAIRKLRSNKQSSSNNKERSHSIGSHSNHNHSNTAANNDFDVSLEAEVDLKKNAVNFDELVSNFQNGTTLKKLQRELEQSKQSMQKSEAFLRNLSMEYLSKL